MRRGQGADALPPRRVVAAPSFRAALENLATQLEDLCFVRVTAVTLHETPRGAEVDLYYVGQGVVLGGAHARALVFFDMKRRADAARLGGAHIADAPLGKSHATSVPQAGWVIAGSLAANSKANAAEKFVLSQWFLEANCTDRVSPLRELHQLIMRGTLRGALALRASLTQPRAAFARSRADVGAALTDRQRARLERDASARDDVWALFRLVVQGNVRVFAVKHAAEANAALLQPATAGETADAASLSLSCKALDFVQGVAMELSDASLLTAFSSLLEAVAPLSSMATLAPWPQTPAQLAPHFPQWPVLAPHSPPPLDAATHYCPTSPAYVPRSPSPAYVPHSPPLPTDPPLPLPTDPPLPLPTEPPPTGGDGRYSPSMPSDAARSAYSPR